MADSHAPLLPQSVLRNLADKLYEKRKNAALEVEGIVKQLTQTGEHDKISTIINSLIKDFALSPQANHRKGGLIGLAAATVGLSSEAAQHLEKIVPPVLQSFSDQDSRVRYYACEALYNIAKVSRGDFIIFFNDVFEALMKLSADVDPNVQNAAHLLDRLVKDIVTESDQFSIEEFIPVLREKMNVINPFVRQFLVGWITVLDSVPDIDMLNFLPDFLDGLFNMLGDSNPEIKVQADSALKEFLLEIKNSSSVDFGRMTEILVVRASSTEEYPRLVAITWINEFVKLGGAQLIPYYADILEAVLSCISDDQENIRETARETNEEQMQRIGPMSLVEGFKINEVLNITHRVLSSQSECTRIESLRWILLLLKRFRFEVIKYLDDDSIPLYDKLSQMLSDPSDEVLLLVLEIQAAIAMEESHFHRFMLLLINKFNNDRYSLLEKRGSLIFRQLCVLLDSEKIYREMAKILGAENYSDFATIMVQALNLILLTTPELTKLREKIKKTLSSSDGKNLFFAIYPSWCHSPVSIISLCFLAQAYEHACSLISCLEEGDITVNFLIQVDKFVHLLETPVFGFLRLQLLEPGKYRYLFKALYGLLMILPQQSTAWKILRTRLKSVPIYAFMHISSQHNPSLSSSPPSSSLAVAAEAAGMMMMMAPSSPQHFYPCENAFTTPNSPTSQGSNGSRNGNFQTSSTAVDTALPPATSRHTLCNGLVNMDAIPCSSGVPESGSVVISKSDSKAVEYDSSDFDDALQIFRKFQKRHSELRLSSFDRYSRKVFSAPESESEHDDYHRRKDYDDDSSQRRMH